MPSNLSEIRPISIGTLPRRIVPESFHLSQFRTFKSSSKLLRPENGPNKDSKEGTPENDTTTRGLKAKSEEEKAAEDEKAKGGLKELKRIIGLARPEAVMIVGAVALLFVSSGVTMSVPYFTGRLLDIISSSPDTNLFETMKTLYPFIGGIFVVGAAANAGRVFLIQYSGARLVARLRSTLYETIATRPMSFFDKNRTGELISRISTDVQIMSRVVTQNISDGLRSIVTVVVGTGMLLSISPKLTGIMMLILPVLAVAARTYGRFVRSLSKKTQEALARAVEEAEEKLSNLRTVRSFGREKLEVTRFDARIAEILRLAKVETIASATFFSMAGLAGNSTLLAVLFFGSNMVNTGAISIGELTSFLLYCAYVGGSLTGLGSFWTVSLPWLFYLRIPTLILLILTSSTDLPLQDMNRGLGASTRVFAILDEPVVIPKGSVVIHPEAQHSTAGDATVTISAPLVANTASTGLRPHLAGHIEFNKVAFKYPTRETPIFTDLSFSVPAGTVVGIVGESGGGKSTVASLLLRLYDVDAGSVTIDGIDLRTIDPTWFRQEIVGVVSQEPALFVGTVMDNIRYGRLDATDEEVYAAAREANCFDFVNSFPERFQTKLGERGVNLSGGQRQRLAIARAVLRNPKILVLDEASSALDSQSEFLVHLALERLMKGRTVIIIAHRLSTLRSADSLLVIQNGRGEFRAVVSGLENWNLISSSFDASALSNSGRKRNLGRAHCASFRRSFPDSGGTAARFFV